MKKIFSLVLVSVLGGVITLSAYKLFIEKDQPITALSTPQEQASYFPTSNTNAAVYNTANVPNFVEAADKTVHAVVHVKNTAIVSSPNSFADLFYGNSPRARVGTGSGVIISPDGYIITNNHVINGASSISITSNDNKIYEAKLVGTDEKTDIALLKIDADEDLPYVAFGNSDQVKIGEWVLAVGNPFNLTSTVTAGIISAKSRDLTGGNFQSFIQTDAAVNPGNSGGALVNSNGDLIGINTAISSQTGSYIGYSFAVPSNIARKVVEDIMEYGDVQNGILGVTGGALNSLSAEKIGVDTSEGFYVNSVEEGSGAELAGLKSGDVIKKLDHIKISKFADLKGYLSTKRPNDVIDVTILRDASTKVVPVTLLKNETLKLPIVGVIKNAKQVELKRYKVENGVKIAALDKKYEPYWRKNGIVEGSILTAINDIKINSVEEAEQIIKNKSDYEPLKFEIINKNGQKENFHWR